MATKQQVVGLLKKSFGQKQDVMPWQIATLGDGHGTVIGSTGNNMVLCRLSANSSVIEVYNAAVQPVDGMLVRIGRKPEQPLIWQVLGQYDQRLDENGAPGSALYNTPMHHHTHEYPQSDQVNIDWRQITAMRIYAVSGFVVGVLPGLIPRSGDDIIVQMQTIDLSSHVPALGALYVLVSVDAAGALTLTDGVTQANILYLALTDIPDTPAGHFRLAAVRLYSGQVAIQENNQSLPDIVDLRWPQEFTAGGGGSGGGGGSWANVKIAAATGGDFSSIQPAVNSLASLSANFPIVLIAPGAYPENLVLNNNVSLIAMGGAVIINPPSGAPLTMAGGQSWVTGIELAASGGSPAIAFSASSQGRLILEHDHLVGDLDQSLADPSTALVLSYSTRITGITTCAGELNSNGDDIVGSVSILASCPAFRVTGGHIGGNLSYAASVIGLLDGLPRISGTVSGSGTLSGDYINGNGQLTTEATSGSPIVVNNSTLVTGLNSDLLDGQHAAAFAPASHNLLSSTHGDTTAASVSRGDMITGQGASAKWSRLAISVPAVNVLNVLGAANGDTEPAWKTVLDNTNPTTLSAGGSAAPGTSLVFSHRDHVHAITAAPGLLGNGTSQYQYIVTGGSPFAPGYSTGFLNIASTKTLTANNSLTLGGTDGGAVSFAVTSGKTLTLTTVDNFNLTVPTTGTAALLGVANVFSAAQTVTVNGSYGGGNLQIALTDGAAPAKQLVMGYDHANDFAVIESFQAGVGNRRLVINGNGNGPVNIGGVDSVTSGPFAMVSDILPQISILGKTNLNNRLYIAYDTSLNYGYIYAITEGAAFRNLSLSPLGGKVGVRTTMLASGVTYQNLSVSGGLLLASTSSSQEREMATFVPSYVVNTDASRTARVVCSVYDASGAREWIRGEASGSAPMIGFLGASAVAQQSGDIIAGLNNFGLFSGASLKLSGIHASTPITYISGTGTAGVDNTAQTVKGITLAANTLTQVGDRMRIRAYWSGDTGSPVTGSTKIGPSGSEVLVSNTTDGGAATLQINEAWLHYIDNTHANIIENESGALGALSAPNVAGFTWNASQSIIFTQDAISNNHTIIYALIVDVFPKGV